MNFTDRADWIVFLACSALIAGLIVYWAVLA